VCCVTPPNATKARRFASEARRIKPTR
jgi:hypothetical protein